MEPINYDSGDAEELEASALDAFETSQELGLDFGAVSETALVFAGKGADPAVALEAAVDLHDLSGLDETQALEKIQQREELKR